MKIEWNKKYNTIAAYTALVLMACIVFYLGISKVDLVKTKLGKYLSIFRPFVIGLAMAYLFNFILVFIEEKIISKKIENQKKARTISMVATYIIVIIMLVLFLNFIFPQLISSIGGLVNKIPRYVQDANNLAEKLRDNLNLDSYYTDLVSEEWEKLVDNMILFGKNLLPKIGGFAKDIVSIISNLVLGLIISIYILFDKEKFGGLINKLVTASFSDKNKGVIYKLVYRAHSIFGKFLSGKILDSIIVGLLTFAILSIVKMPYTLLISFIIGMTNIVPFFGPFIGAIPSFFIILFEAPIKSIWFLVIIVIIQQIDGNIIGPKILGDSLGISAFWILFSLLVAGKLFGALGLIIGVPLFVFIYSIIRDLVNYKLEEKGLPTNSYEYYKK